MVSYCTPLFIYKKNYFKFCYPSFSCRGRRLHRQNYFWNRYLNFKGLFLSIYKRFLLIFVENCTPLIKSKHLNNCIINYIPIDRSGRDQPEYCKKNKFLTVKNKLFSIFLIEFNGQLILRINKIRNINIIITIYKKIDRSCNDLSKQYQYEIKLDEKIK